MRWSAALGVLLLACCGRHDPGHKEPSMVETRTPDASNPCARSLAALARGALADYQGIDGCTRAAVSSALGAGGPERSGPFGRYQAFGASPGAPAGLVVFFAGDAVSMVEVDAPALAAPIESTLGAPDGTAMSRLEPMHTQLIYAARGLVAHVDNDSRAVFRMFAIPPTTVDAFLTSPLSRLEIRDEPIE